MRNRMQENARSHIRSEGRRSNEKEQDTMESDLLHATCLNPRHRIQSIKGLQLAVKLN